MMNFLIANWKDVVFIAIVILAFALLYYFKKINEIKSILRTFVIKAEEKYGGGTGELKFETVTVWIYEKLSPLAKIVFSKNQIDKFIQNAVDWMKEYLNTNDEARAKVTTAKKV